MKKTQTQLLNEIKNNKDLTQEQKDVVVGTILGDSHIKISKKGLITLTWGYANKAYANFVFAIMKNLCNSESSAESITYDKRYKKWRYAYTFSTRSLVSLVSFGLLFTQRIISTVVPVGIIGGEVESKVKYTKVMASYYVLYELLTPRALAFWIMDDGHNYLRGGLTLCTDSFTLIEVLILKFILEIKFNLICTIHTKTKKDKTGVYYRIYISSSSMPTLHSLVFPFMSPEMLYKIDIKNKAPLSLSNKNVKARADRLEIRNWKLENGKDSLPPKHQRVYSSNPRAIKARLARQKAAEAKKED